jgi:hypothetical protein
VILGIGIHRVSDRLKKNKKKNGIFRADCLTSFSGTRPWVVDRHQLWVDQRLIEI